MRRRGRALTVVVTVVFTVLVLAFVLTLAWRYGYAKLRRAMYPMKYEEIVRQCAEEYELPPSLIFAVIYTESKFNPDAQSAVGAKGLMQLMDGTYEWVQKRLTDDPQPLDRIYEPEVNIRCGCRLMQYLVQRFDNIETALAAYNAGVGRVTTWLSDTAYSDDGVTLKEIPLEETRRYVERVTKARDAYQTIYTMDEEES